MDNSPSKDKALGDIIHYFASSLFRLNTVDEVLWDLSKNCIAHLGLEDCVIYLLDSERGVLVQKAAYGPKNPKEYVIVQPIEIPLGRGIVGSVARTGVAEIVADTTKDTRYIEDDALRYSEITVPIKSESGLLGIIDSEHSQKDFFTSWHLHVLELIGALCASKITALKIASKSGAKVATGKGQPAIQLAAHQARLNPHFLYNSLNAIQSFILLKKSEQAMKYLSKFSKLMRQSFRQLNEAGIVLADELLFLTNYLDLQKLRFGQKFDYQVIISPEVDIHNVELPGTLLIPFVENAVNVGFAHEMSGGMLKIEVTQDETWLILTIEDNGIGRAEGKSLVKKKSSGLEKNYLPQHDQQLWLNEAYKMHINITTTDLCDSSGRPSGTTVCISIPLAER